VLFSTVVLPEFGSGSDRSRIWPFFFKNPAKSVFGKISSRIWQMSVLLQCFELIIDKTNAAE